MKALVELALIWGVTLAVVLAAILLNLWLVHLITMLVSIKTTWVIIAVGAVMATAWVLSFGGKKQ